jgi:short-subunit dehydrogenase
VTQTAEMENWLLAADDDSPVDCVIACAGAGGGSALAGTAGESAETARRIFEVNVHGVVNTVVPLLPRMVARRSGHVVVIASVAGLIALPDSPAYSASKAAVIIYGEGLRRLLRPHGIAVTLVCPGFVDTEMVRSLSMRPPFMWSSERAAAVVLQAVRRRRTMVVFPWQMRGGIWLSRVLPRFIVDRILDRLRAGTFQK